LFLKSKCIGIKGLAAARPMLSDGFVGQTLQHWLGFGERRIPPLVRGDFLKNGGGELLLLPIRKSRGCFERLLSGLSSL
jgi:hypothetical protein